ncbi:hypothetical protein BC941DRAFT_441289 [Chlamydoabsidia padenii]|nr:hypothetical protein BC941DRAFT_441289 [Chlamydoabsidia padenii]
MLENNVFFGTAFPQQTERDKRVGASDSGQFIPVWKQEARDDQGRRRFHGAFTGGFSAGYYNTVGSKEGWTPGQFVSSRTSRHEQRAARVEDFMDEEDLEVLASSKELVARDEFDLFGGAEKELENRQQQLGKDTRRGGEMSLLTSSLMNLVAPAPESIGTRLLQKMGWRSGQGVGPRAAFVDNDQSPNSKTGLKSQQQMTLAPKDTPIVDYQAKTNVYGLGYNLMKNVPQIAEMRRFQQQQKDQHDRNSKLGIGLFDTEDDDNVILYDDEEPGLSQKYHRTLYDASEFNMEKPTIVNGDQQAKEKARCPDGLLPLKGFHLSNKSQELGKWYPPPKVPNDFVETHFKASTSDTNTLKTKKPQLEITTDVRGAMLGETPIETRSVFDYLSSKSKEKLAQATFNKNTMTLPIIDKTRLQVTLVPKDVARLALQGFIPFGDTPEKQARYKRYLEISLENQCDPDGNSSTTFEIPVGLTHESGMKELDEFTKAARIFRPISSMMSGRFTSSSSLSNETPKSSHIEHVAFEGGLKTEEQWKKEKEIRENQIIDEPKQKLSQEAEAAVMNMFGPLTRTQRPFYPNRLVCKRFSVRNPHPDYVQQGPGHRTQAGSTSALNEKSMANMFTPPSSELNLAETQNDDPALNSIIAKPSSRTFTDKDSSKLSTEDNNTSLTTKLNQENNSDDDLTYVRPTMDIFKAIFETSDNDESTDVNNENTLSPPNIISKDDIQSQKILSSKSFDDDEIMIGPPPPPSSSSSSSPFVAESLSFRPLFTKPESQDTKMRSKEVVVAPFQPRLLTSKKGRTQRRRLSLSSENSTSSSEDDHNDVYKGEKKQQHNRRRKSNDKKKSSKKSKSNDGKKKQKRKHNHAHDDYDDNNDDIHRHRQTKIKDHDKKTAISRQMDDMSMWVEKKPSTKRKHAEDLW